MTLDEYFHVINKPKEFSMFEAFKAKMTAWFTHTWEFKDAPPAPSSKAFLEFKAEIDKAKEELTKPTTFEDNSVLGGYDDGYWAFEMYTPEWINEYGETLKPVHTVLVEPHEGTWMEVLDNVLDAMEAHYGYSIKEQVYYSVTFPLNDTDDKGNRFPGYGRCLNDERLQQILLAFPELYLSGGWSNSPEREAMFK